MAELSRREALTGTALATLSVVVGGRLASDAAAAPVTGAMPSGRPTPGALKVAAYGVAPDRGVVVATLADGELWAYQDGQVSVQRAAGGVVVTALRVKRAAKSTILVSVAGQDDVKVPVDTRPEALRTSPLRVVNKRIALSAQDEPKKLVAVHDVMVDERLKKPLEAMFAKAEKDKAKLAAISAHRSFEYQKKLYDEYSKRDGQKAADTFSARPGHSEHQLGLALDVRGADGKDALDPAFKNTTAGTWLAAHAHEFGFVIRYPEHAKAVTGYEPEPWHLRFVGPEVARFLHERRDITTLEALFGLPDAPGY